MGDRRCSRGGAFRPFLEVDGCVFVGILGSFLLGVERREVGCAVVG